MSNKDGVFGGENVQILMLKADGVKFIDETHVDMENFCIDMSVLA